MTSVMDLTSTNSTEMEKSTRLSKFARRLKPFDFELNSLKRSPREKGSSVKSNSETLKRGFICLCINVKSGSGDGQQIMAQLNELKNAVDPMVLENGLSVEIGVVDLGESLEDIHRTFKTFLDRMKEYDEFRVVAAGGDGTVKWVFDIMNDLGVDSEDMPKVAILPLGTGNEIGRCVGWGASNNGKKMAAFIKDAMTGEEVMLDRWIIKFTNEEGDYDEKVMFAFFSIGFDAKISENFHNYRNSSSSSKSSRTKNKFWYFMFGVQELLSSSDSIKNFVQICVNEKPLDFDSKASSLQVFNIHSSADGIDFWQTEHKSKSKDLVSNEERIRPSLNDGIVEVVTTNGVLHLTKIRTGLTHSRRLAQTLGDHITIKTSKPVPVQIDGEPWILPPSTIQLEYAGQVKLVKGPGSLKNVIPYASPPTPTRSPRSTGRNSGSRSENSPKAEPDINMDERRCSISDDDSFGELPTKHDIGDASC